MEHLDGNDRLPRQGALEACAAQRGSAEVDQEVEQGGLHSFGDSFGSAVGEPEGTSSPAGPSSMGDGDAPKAACAGSHRAFEPSAGLWPDGAMEPADSAVGHEPEQEQPVQPGSARAVCGKRYDSLYDRLVANTLEPETDDGCWVWKGKRSGSGYGSLNLYLAELGKLVTLKAHILMWVLVASGEKSAYNVWLAYNELREAGLELDHVCRNPLCIRPCHCAAVTPLQNIHARDSGRHQPWFMPEVPHEA